MTISVFYPGSFDPVTNGHFDIIARAASLFDGVVIGVGVHHGKEPLFTGEERVAMLEDVLEPLRRKFGTPISLVTFDDLAVSAAKREGTSAIIRGVRDASDFDYEMQMTGMNGAMAEELETIFLPASASVRHVAAKFVRQIAVLGGDVSPFVPERVATELKAKFRG